MDKKPKIKLTENKSNQINISDSLNSIYSNRKTIKIKTKKKLFLSEEKENNIKNANSNNNILFPKIKNDVIYNMKQSHKNLSINNSFSNNIQKIGKSFSNKINIIKNPNYIKLNSLFLYPKVSPKRNFPNKINYSNSIDVSNKKRFKNLKLNILNNNNIKLNLLKIQNKKENDQLYEIKNFMKMKYYEDTSAKMEKELKDDSFVDRGDKDKLIQIGKFHVFWKNVLDYCGGYIFAQRMKNISLQNSTDETKNKIKLKKIPNNRIYTSILRSKLIHYKNNL
jgi:hypothetical protein